MRNLILLVVLASGVFAQPVKVGFGPDRPEVGPFPTDFLTVADDQQKSGRRVNLPLPNCDTQVSDCQELALLNQLDGFNVQARLTVQFSGAVNVDTLRTGMFVAWLDGSGKLTKINRVTWNPATLTMTAKPDDVLRQGTRYALLVTDAVKDTTGAAVVADDGFAACLAQQIGGQYCADVSTAVTASAPALAGLNVVGGAVFTTLSGTALMEAAYAAVAQTAPLVQITGSLALRNVLTFTLRAQVKTSGEKFSDIPFPASPQALALIGINRIVFGTVRSLHLINETGYIPQQPTLTPLPATIATEDVGFHVLLPSTPKPAGGYPVLLAAHGFGDNRFGGPSVLAQSFLSRGYAIVALNAVGHGYGPESVARALTATGTVEIPAPGRALDLDGDGNYTDREGCLVLQAGAPYSIRDCVRQTAVDWMAMTRAIRLGVDLDGDGQADLDGTRLSFWGQSLGAFVGTVFLGVEPNVGTAVLNVGGGSSVEAARISPGLHPYVVGYLGLRTPSLLNVADGKDFDEQYAGRDAAVRVLDLAGAADIQDQFERLEWLEASGAPMTYAPLLKTAPLAGAAAKHVLFQFAIGDQVVPNPANSLLVRAADGLATTSVYRHDIARQLRPELPADPHAYFAFLLDPNGAPISLALLGQVADFVQAGTDAVPDANAMVRLFFGQDLFETPAVLPETTGFLPQ